MTTIYFGDRIKQLRKKKDWTQEQLAEMLNVSPQAVSKWETGNALPDVSLLPIIANLFSVSVDSLLGVDIIKKEESVAAVVAEADQLCAEKRFADAVSFLRNALVQYPAEPKILYRLAWNLTGTISENRQNLNEAIELYEKLLKICDDPQLRLQAIRDLMYRYITAGDEDKARELAGQLPDFAVCREYNLGRSNLLSGRELAAYLQSNIRLYGEAMKECMEYFLQERILSKEEMEPYSIEIASHKMELLKQILEE